MRKNTDELMESILKQNRHKESLSLFESTHLKVIGVCRYYSFFALSFFRSTAKFKPLLR